MSGRHQEELPPSTTEAFNKALAAERLRNGY
jgi:hypothetical protein